MSMVRGQEAPANTGFRGPPASEILPADFFTIRRRFPGNFIRFSEKKVGVGPLTAS